MKKAGAKQYLLFAFYVLVALWLTSLIVGLAGKVEIAMREAEEAERRYQALEERKEGLEDDLRVLGTPLGQDAAIRRSFGVARPGEEVIVVVPPKAATTTPEPTWWERLKNWF